MPTTLQGIANKARQSKKYKFQNLYHLLNLDFLRECFFELKKNAAPGVDQVDFHEYQEDLEENLEVLVIRLKKGSYRANQIRRKFILKPNGKLRPLGILCTEDKIIQKGVAKIFTAIYEAEFLDCSYGYRPKRGAQGAARELDQALQFGPFGWIVEADIQGFFDQVHHQRLMARLARNISDKRLLSLIGRMLKAKVVMPDGVKVSTDEGLPQGGPLSPLLSNIVLSELDEELAARKLRFVRYADDCNIYVRSERAGKRVMASVERFISSRLRLKVNQSKSAVAKPETRHFLGFRLLATDGKPEILLSERSEKRLRERILELTPRSAGRSLSSTISQINRYLQGWKGFFGKCTAGIVWVLQGIDAHIRRRLRAIVLKHWKRKLTIAKRLIQLGVNRKTAWRRVYESRKGIWALSHSSAVERGLRNAYFAERGLVSLKSSFEILWSKPIAPVQLTLDWDTARS